MAVLYYHETGEGIQNTANSTVYKWTGRDYVPYFNWSDLGTWNLREDLVIYNQTSSYDLSKFKIGHEVSFYMSIITNNSGGYESGTWQHKVYRKLIGQSEVLQFTYNFSYSLNDGFSSAAWTGTGVDYDEEWDNIEHMKYEIVINGVSAGSKTVTYTNGQTYSSLVTSSSKQGSLWVEGDNLAFIDGAYDGSRYAKHLIRHDGTSYSTGKTPGMMWLDTSAYDKICYVDSSGVERRTYPGNNKWNTSTLATGQTPGMIWVSGGNDTYSYLNFIGNDGKQYCIINGTAAGY